MQEHRLDGTVEMTQDVEREQVIEALNNPNNRKVALFKDGEHAGTMPAGRNRNFHYAIEKKGGKWRKFKVFD